MIQRSKAFTILIVVLLASVILVACDSQGDVTQESETESADSITTEISEPETAEGVTDAVETEDPEPPEAITHVLIPESPLGSGSILTDRSTAVFASEGRALADNFEINILERPFTPEDMEYRPELDIVRAEISLNGDFLYISILLEGTPNSEDNATYGIEFDLDTDGRGDWLVFGSTPLNEGWTTDGVRACTDEDEDVGGARAMRSDPPNESLTGYENCVFDSGQGISPDEAWIRMDPDNSNRIQIAVLHSLVGFDEGFVWSVFADANGTEPSFFDYHDQITLQEAGSADITNENYPLNALGLFDNTCRWSYGFTPTGLEIGICQVPATPAPASQPSGCVQPPPPSSDPCWIWFQDSCQWICYN